MTVRTQQPVEKVVSTGRAIFGDASLEQLARGSGEAAAWRQLLGESAARQAQMLQAVRGDFSFAWRQADGQVHLFVDAFATRSLCWRLHDGQLEFAARADELAGTDAEIDSQAIFDYLYFHCIPSPRTIYKGIYRLPAGHALHFDGAEVKVWRYWTPRFEPAAQANFGTLKSEFNELLKGAVARTLDGSKPACFLSGGTDSSSVAGLVRAVTGEGADSYSIGFEAEGYDEMAYARLAAQHFDARHHEYYVTPQDIVDSMAQVAAHYDQPFGNSSALPAYYCARMAEADGVGKLLAGDGGDELFGGNSRYAKQRQFGWYQQVPEGLRSGFIEPLLSQPWAQKMGLLRKGASYVEQASVGMPARLQMYNLLLRLKPAEVLTPAFLDQIDGALPLAHQQDTWSQVAGASELNTTLAFDWRYTLGESDLPKVVGMTSLAGVEVGFPFLDGAVLDFSTRLPDDYKLKGLKLRWFFKEALRGFLPDEIITKKKQGFGLPFGTWACKHAALGRMADDALDGLVDRGLLRADFRLRLTRELMPSFPGYYGELVWILSSLELWMRAQRPQWRAP